MLAKTCLAAVGPLARHISSSVTATEALNAWCAEHMPGRSTAVIAKVITDEVSDRSAYDGCLQIGEWETLRYRQVALLWGETIVSEAENWYFPERLPKRMRSRLLSSNQPFGQIVRELEPSRAIVAMDGVVAPAQCADEVTCASCISPPQNFVLHIRAVLTIADGTIIAEVCEHYRHELIGRSFGNTGHGRRCVATSDRTEGRSAG